MESRNQRVTVEEVIAMNRAVEGLRWVKTAALGVAIYKYASMEQVSGMLVPLVVYGVLWAAEKWFTRRPN